MRLEYLRSHVQPKAPYIDMTDHRDASTTVACAIEYDARTGIAYTRPILFDGAEPITADELDWLGLGPNGEYSK